MATLFISMISIATFSFIQLNHYVPKSEIAVIKKIPLLNTIISKSGILGRVEESLLTNGLKITVLDCRRDSTRNTLTFHLSVENSGTDAKVTLTHASAFEREGDEFNCVKSGAFFSDNVNSGREVFVSLDVLGVPIQTDYIRKLKFSVYNSNTEQETIAEFKNISVAR